MKSRLNRVCEQLNIKNRNARNASRASSELFSYLFFRDKDLREFAMVSSVQDNGFTLIVPKYGFEGFVEFSEEDFSKNAQLKLNAELSLIQFYHKGTLLRLFDWVFVQIKVTLQNFRKQVQMQVLHKEIQPPVFN